MTLGRLARNVKGLDKNGLSDPIVELYMGTVRQNPLSTKVYNKTVNPQVRHCGFQRRNPRHFFFWRFPDYVSPCHRLKPSFCSRIVP